MRIASARLWTAMGILLLALPASSHHAFTSEFDDTKTATFTGVITKVDWINPHAYFYLEAKDRSGQVITWTLESFPPAALRRAGMTRWSGPLSGKAVITEPGDCNRKNSERFVCHVGPRERPIWQISDHIRLRW
jgi:hypothetical protein